MTDTEKPQGDNARRNGLSAAVPADFPRPIPGSAVAGAQPKLLLVEYEGQYYSPGCTPPELLQRWDVCEDLAKQFAAKSLESKAGKRAHMSEPEILDQYLSRLLTTKWVSDEEARWVIRRAAEILSWPAPPSAQKPPDK